MAAYLDPSQHYPYCPLPVMKRMPFIVLLLALLAGPAVRSATAPEPAQQSSEAVNGVMVIVADEVITKKDVLQYIEATIQSLMDRYRGQPAVLNQRINEAIRQGVEDLVERKLILNEFKTAGYNLPESMIEGEVKRRIQEKYGGDRVNLTKTLQGMGITYESFKKRVREDFILSVMRSMKVSLPKISISPYKIEKYYADNLDRFKVGDEYQLRTIMVNRAGGRTEAAARELAGEILAKLNDGASFAEMAGVYSEDSYRAKGGERGWVELEKERYQKPLEDAVKSLQPGQRSGVIEAGQAFWIVLLEDTKPAHYRPLGEVRDQIERTLVEREADRLRQAWIDQLKAKAFVRYF